MNAQEYVKRIHEDFKRFEHSSGAVFHVPRIRAFGEYILLCLANPESKESGVAFEAIAKKRGIGCKCGCVCCRDDQDNADEWPELQTTSGTLAIKQIKEGE